jgi:hypothetical protein
MEFLRVERAWSWLSTARLDRGDRISSADRLAEMRGRPGGHRAGQPTNVSDLHYDRAQFRASGGSNLRGDCRVAVDARHFWMAGYGRLGLGYLSYAGLAELDCDAGLRIPGMARFCPRSVTLRLSPTMVARAPLEVNGDKCIAPGHFSEPAIRQGSQTCFGIVATNERGADLAWIFERSSRPAFVQPRDRQASPKCAGTSARAWLGV